MNTIVPEGELLRRATEYVLQRIAESNDQMSGREQGATEPCQEATPNAAASAPDKSRAQLTPQQLMKIIDDACMNFNLGPKDAETMLRIFQNGRTGS